MKYKSLYESNFEKFQHQGQDAVILNEAVKNIDIFIRQVKQENIQLRSEIEKASNGKYQQSKATKVDHMMRAAACIVTFSGWQNIQRIRQPR